MNHPTCNQAKKFLHSLRQYDLPLHKYMSMMELEARTSKMQTRFMFLFSNSDCS